MTTSIAAAINIDVLSWAATHLLPWQHDALRRILGGGITTSGYAELLKRAHHDLGIQLSKEALPDLALTTADLPASPNAAERVRVDGIRGLHNVNSIKCTDTLPFGPALTVVYGENGSGKSGYARVFKKVGRCVSAAVEPILPNVYEPDSGLPAGATLDCEVGGKATSIAWIDGEQPAAPLKQVAVFDSRCAISYLTEDSQVTFVPAVLEALRHLSDVTDRVRIDISAAAARVSPGRPAVISQLASENTSVGQALTRLNAATDPKAIEQLAEWSTALDEELSRKTVHLQELNALSPTLIRSRYADDIREVSLFVTSLTQISNALSAEKERALRALVGQVAVATQSYNAATGLLLGDSRLEGVGSDAWRELLLAAASFSTGQAYRGQSFPVTGEDAVCVLCQQPLDAVASERLGRYWSFLQAQTAQQLDVLRHSLKVAVTAVLVTPPGLPPELVGLEGRFESRCPELWSAVAPFLESARSRQAAIQRAVGDGRWDDIPDLAMQAISTGVATLEKLKSESTMITDAGFDKERAAGLEREIREFRAKKRLAEELPVVQQYLADIKQSAAIRSAADTLATNGITIKARQLHETHVTPDFANSIAARIKRLGVRRGGVVLEQRPEKGKVFHSMRLNGAKLLAGPSAVLSEGERTAISLSYFLSDLGEPEETSCIVLDDPVTSLDHRVREGTVTALVSEAKRRQVVVFTHDLAFFVELTVEAEHQEVGCATSYVQALGPAVGLVQGGAPWDAMPLKERLPVLTSDIAAASDAEAAADVQRYRNDVYRFYSRLRATWERAVEELVFNKVVQRYQRPVKTLSLSGVAVDADSIAQVFGGMTRCSNMTDAHDHATASGVALPIAAELRGDLDALQVFIKSQTAKKNAAEKTNAHLKA